MTTPPPRPTVRLWDVTVSGHDDPAALLAAVRDAVAATVADPVPRQDAVRSAIASAVTRTARPS